MNRKQIGVFVGSLRKKSFSQAIANAMMRAKAQDMELVQMDLGGLPIFNQDLDDENRPPQQWTEFREKVNALDGFLFVTPEYNRSVPPVLKNAIDIASRPPGNNAWGGKPGAVISVSPGRIGGFGANHHLRQTLTCLNVLTMQHPEAYIGGINELLDATGALSDERTVKLIHGFMDSFEKWVDTVSK